MDLKANSKPVFFSTLLTVWFLLVWLWPAASPDSNSDKEKDEVPTQEDLYRSNLTQANFGLLGVRFFESQDGEPQWEINSDFAELHRAENYAFLKKVKANFSSAATQNKISSESDYGRSWTDKNKIELEGNVSVQSSKGYIFLMNRLNYDGKKHELNTSESVQMKGPNINKPIMWLNGTGLKANIDQEHFILKHNVSAKKKLENGDWLKITSQSGEFFTADSKAVFIENVVMRNKNQSGYADKAFLEVGGNEVILEGNAKIESDNNTIEGKRIKLFTDDDRIEVDEAEGRTSNDAPR